MSKLKKELVLSNYESFIKYYEIKDCNNHEFKYETKIITRINNEWIKDNTLIIPKCDGVFNLLIDGNNLDYFNKFDLRNIKSINGLTAINCEDLNSIIINDCNRQYINIKINDLSDYNKSLTNNKLLLIIENNNIINSFGNKFIKLKLNKLSSINTINNEYIINYDNGNNYIKVNSDLDVFECNSKIDSLDIANHECLLRKVLR